VHWTPKGDEPIEHWMDGYICMGSYLCLGGIVRGAGNCSKATLSKGTHNPGSPILNGGSMSMWKDNILN